MRSPLIRGLRTNPRMHFPASGASTTLVKHRPPCGFSNRTRDPQHPAAGAAAAPGSESRRNEKESNGENRSDAKETLRSGFLSPAGLDSGSQ